MRGIRKVRYIEGKFFFGNVWIRGWEVGGIVFFNFFVILGV